MPVHRSWIIFRALLPFPSTLPSQLQLPSRANRRVRLHDELVVPSPSLLVPHVPSSFHHAAQAAYLGPQMALLQPDLIHQPTATEAMRLGRMRSKAFTTLHLHSQPHGHPQSLPLRHNTLPLLLSPPRVILRHPGAHLQPHKALQAAPTAIVRCPQQPRLSIDPFRRLPEMVQPLRPSRLSAPPPIRRLALDQRGRRLLNEATQISEVTESHLQIRRTPSTLLTIPTRSTSPAQREVRAVSVRAAKHPICRSSPADPIVSRCRLFLAPSFLRNRSIPWVTDIPQVKMPNRIGNTQRPISTDRGCLRRAPSSASRAMLPRQILCHGHRSNKGARATRKTMAASLPGRTATKGLTRLRGSPSTVRGQIPGGFLSKRPAPVAPRCSSGLFSPRWPCFCAPISHAGFRSKAASTIQTALRARTWFRRSKNCSYPMLLGLDMLLSYQATRQAYATWLFL